MQPSVDDIHALRDEIQPLADDIPLLNSFAMDFGILIAFVFLNKSKSSFITR